MGRKCQLPEKRAVTAERPGISGDLLYALWYGAVVIPKCSETWHGPKLVLEFGVHQMQQDLMLSLLCVQHRG